MTYFLFVPTLKLCQTLRTTTRHDTTGAKIMEFHADKMTSNEIRKAARLITRADELGVDLSGYGDAAVNPSSGNTYLWLEDYVFTLFMGPGGGDTIWALWSDPYDGEEHEMEVLQSTELSELDQWTEALATRADADNDGEA